MNYKGLLQTFDRSCYLTTSVQQDIVNGSSVPLEFDIEIYDTDNFHSLVSNTDRITINKAGKYLFNAGVRLQETFTGDLRIEIAINGTTYTRTKQSSLVSMGINASLIFDCANGDYAQAIVTHSHTAPRKMSIPHTYFQCHMMPPENTVV